MKKVLLVFVCSLSLLACNHHKKIKDIDQLNWLLGNWEAKSDNGVKKLSWHKENDSLYNGEEIVPIKDKGELKVRYTLGVNPNTDALYYKVERPSNMESKDLATKNLDFTAELKHSHHLSLYYNSQKKESEAFELVSDSTLVKKNYGLMNMSDKPMTETMFHKVP